ncbi:coiled-coil domain-containing protein 43 [Megalops cyprinoides]|uniref:coiled-coil domain-containing protein 43 n=1 Tax=Megalops cyprinoides TaxID=118141 RepID=UPI0018640E8D|nr:coiled-coil domain-containing protein 43 [Megalops cyprinoides]
MAAPERVADEFESWLNIRLESLGVDRDVYGTYILGVLQEEETDDEKTDALQGIMSAFLEDDTLEDVCREIIRHWTESCSSSSAKNTQSDAEVQAIANMIEKQAQIVVKQKEVSEEARKRKEALLAQYANVSDGEDEGAEEEETGATCTFDSEKSLFKNTNVEDVLAKRKLQREQARESAQKKKEQDKMQREKDKLAKQERKDKEKKRTQKGERKR